MVWIQKEYDSRPEVKQRKKEYSKLPEVIAQRRLRIRNYRKKKTLNGDYGRCKFCNNILGRENKSFICKNCFKGKLHPYWKNLDEDRVCKICGELKSKEYFYKSYSKCKACILIRSREYYLENKDNIKKRNKNWQQNNRDRINISRRKRKLKNPQHFYLLGRSWQLKQYGLSFEEYEIMLRKQKNKCLICKKTMKKICVDHNHKTNKVRGLLCDQCNKGIGIFNDNIDLLKEGIKYLETYK